MPVLQMCHVTCPEDNKTVTFVNPRTKEEPDKIMNENPQHLDFWSFQASRWTSVRVKCECGHSFKAWCYYK